jgi:hypothetical protein
MQFCREKYKYESSIIKILLGNYQHWMLIDKGEEYSYIPFLNKYYKYDLMNTEIIFDDYNFIFQSKNIPNAFRIVYYFDWFPSIQTEKIYEGILPPYNFKFKNKWIYLDAYFQQNPRIQIVDEIDEVIMV